MLSRPLYRQALYDVTPARFCNPYMINLLVLGCDEGTVLAAACQVWKGGRIVPMTGTYALFLEVGSSQPCSAGSGSMHSAENY